jgi:hypothetical protein
MALPHDFRALGKAPMPPPGQGGNPLQISGNKLQENFEYLDKKQADILPGGGLLDGDNPGDMLYWDGTDWILLAAPAAPATDEAWVMHHSGTAPSWNLYDKVTVDICVSGTPTEYTILGIPTP